MWRPVGAYAGRKSKPSSGGKIERSHPGRPSSDIRCGDAHHACFVVKRGRPNPVFIEPASASACGRAIWIAIRLKSGLGEQGRPWMSLIRNPVPLPPRTTAGPGGQAEGQHWYFCTELVTIRPQRAGKISADGVNAGQLHKICRRSFLTGCPLHGERNEKIFDVVRCRRRAGRKSSLGS